MQKAKPLALLMLAAAMWSRLPISAIPQTISTHLGAYEDGASCWKMEIVLLRSEPTGELINLTTLGFLKVSVYQISSNDIMRGWLTCAHLCSSLRPHDKDYPIVWPI